MYSSNNKHYVFKQSSGKVWSFFYDERLGICCSSLGRKNTWSSPSSLRRNAYNIFSADIDDKDRFHVLFQDKQGNISYCLIENGSVNTVPVLNSKRPTAYNKHLRLAPFKDSVHLFYVLQHKDSVILAHQTLTGGKVQTPKVIDYVTENTCPYSIVHDRSNNIYAFYQSSDGKYLQMGYKKYIPSQKFWSEFTPVTRYQGNCEFPRTIVDNNDVIHICYQRRSSKQYELVYQQKIPDKNIWTDELVVHSSAYPFNESSILRLDDNIIVYWVRDDIIYYCLSKDRGKTWGKPSKYNFPVGRQLVCVSYKTNDPYEKERVSIENVPGSFIKGIKMAFYQEIADSLNNVSEDDLKSIITDSLQELKGSIDELEESDKNIKEEMLKLNKTLQDLEKEVIKYSVKLNSIENEIRKVRNIDSKLENYKSIIEKSENQTDKTAELKQSILNEIMQSELLKKNTEDIETILEKIKELESKINTE